MGRAIIPRICQLCGGDFLATRYDVKKGYGKFCSRLCHTKSNGRKNINRLCGEQRGENNPNWRGGITLHFKGYVYEHAPEHPHATKTGYVLQHRLAVERYLNRYLGTEEVVHHIDGNVQNNSIDNLVLFASTSDHTKHHCSLR